MYRTILTSTWQDPWFVDLTPEGKCLFLFLFTNPRVTSCGAMEISLSQIAFETKLAPKRIDALLTAFGSKVLWRPDLNVLVVRNFYRHQRSQSSQSFTESARKALALFPDVIQRWVGGVYPELNLGWDEPKPTLPSTLPPTVGGKETATATATGAANAPAGAPPRESRIPVDFELDEDMISWAEAKGFSRPQIDHHTEAFCAFWKSKPGKDAKKLDWRLTWQVWIGKEQPGKWPGAPTRANGYQNGRASPVSACPYPLHSHAGEDWERLHQGMEPAWGSAQGGIDNL